MNELTNFQAQAVAVAVNKMLTGKHFSICDFDSIAKVLGVEVDSQDYATIRTLHCVDYADMPVPLRNELRQKVVTLLGLKDVVIKQEQASPPPAAEVRPRLSLFRRRT